MAIGRPAAFGNAPTLGAVPANDLRKPIVAIAPDPVGRGYWLVASDGGVFGYGTSTFHGSAGAIALKRPIVGAAAAPDGKGYWLAASDGGIFTYGSASFFGSTGGIRLRSPIVGMAPTHDGKGYWLVAADGGVFTFGDAHFYGSTGSYRLSSPVVGMAVDPAGTGYWLTSAYGGVYQFGSAQFHGSAVHYTAHTLVTGIAASHYGGYWLTAANGSVWAFSANFHGSLPASALSAAKAEVMAIAPDWNGYGYWLLPEALPPPPPPPPPPVPPSVSLGSTGAAVSLLQQKLSHLGYWVQGVSGSFDDSTQQAVWAFQKVANLPRDGVVGPATWKAILKGSLPHVRSTSGYVIEVNLSDDVLTFVNNGNIQHILNTSTGGGYTYTDSGGTFVANTPVGMFNTYAARDGLVTDSLGQLWRPRYFTGGFAIHGDGYVPPVPVSHGCVRLSNEAINWVWANNLDPIGTEVWVYN